MKTKMEYRAEVVKSMETLARCINDENILDRWLMCGVADCDITEETTLQEIIDMGYTEDETFCDLMTLFLRLMHKAGENGGLYAGGVVSGQRHVEWR